MPAISTPTFQTRNDLASDVRQKIVEMLNTQLAATLDLYTQTKHAHWNIKGPDFYQLHELFDDLATDIFGFIDLIGERTTALGGYALGTLRMASQGSYLPEYPKEAIDGRQHLDALIERYSRYGAECRKCIDTAQNEDDFATGDLFTDVCRAVDKDLWFLEAHVQGQVQRAG